MINYRLSFQNTQPKSNNTTLMYKNETKMANKKFRS